LVIDRPDGVFQLYRLTPKDAQATDALKPQNATTTKLTNFPDGLQSYALSPDRKRLILQHARGGDENTQLTFMDLASPTLETRPILANPKVQAAVNVWLFDSSGFLYSANDTSPDDFYLYRYDFASGQSKPVLSKPGSWRASGITRDAKRALISHDISASNSECYELDLATGKLTDLTIRPKDGTANCNIVGYLPGEKAVLLTSDLRDGRLSLYKRDLGSGKVTEPLPALAGFELDGAGINTDRDMLIAFTNEDGFGVAHVYTLPDLKPLPPPTTEQGVVGGIGFRGHSLVWSLTNSRRPGEAFETVYGTGAKPTLTTRQVTWADRQGIDTSTLPEAKLIKYRSFDGREMPALLYLPAGAKPGVPVPFMVNYHGGPEGESRPAFDGTMQYYLSRGFGVLMPNVRGSTGYGREFQMLDDYQKRWDSVRDGVDAAEWLVANGYALPGHIATYGGSYGGFMSVACIVEDQERVDAGKRKQRMFGACVDVVGIVNFQTFLENTSGYRRKLREVEYGPLTDPNFLATISSIKRIVKIQVPVFIGHGFNDPRVPVEEAMQLAMGLKARGRNPRLFVAPDEGHGFQKLDNRIYFYERVAAFLDETIGAKPTP
jgi:dipeptidyl aminopeptidase/acylaminoacyl peptidase